MHPKIPAVLFLSLLGLGACQSQGGTPSLDTDELKASYGVGHQMGTQLQAAASLIDMDAFMAGVRDGMEGNEMSLSQEELEAAFQVVSAAVQEAETARMATAGGENAAAGDAYRAENGAREGVVTTESGLQYEVLREGTGPRPGPTDQVSIHYRGTLIDGTEFDSSYNRGEPVVFDLGGVIPGFAEGLQLMPVGSQFRLVMPPDLAYGPQGAGGPIGPSATLIFEVELLEIVQ